jgi:hypothetical protein
MGNTSKRIGTTVAILLFTQHGYPTYTEATAEKNGTEMENSTMIVTP